MKNNKIKLIQIKNTDSKIKNSEDGLNGLDTTKKRIRNVLIRCEELTQNVPQERQGDRKYKKILRDRNKKLVNMFTWHL